MKKNISTDRYEIRSDQPEDQRLSPYVPLWLLAWGASMNVQYCTGAGFLSYIANALRQEQSFRKISTIFESRPLGSD